MKWNGHMCKRIGISVQQYSACAAVIARRASGTHLDYSESLKLIQAFLAGAIAHKSTPERERHG